MKKTWQKILLAVVAVALVIFVIISMVNSGNQGKQIADLQAQLKATPASTTEPTPTATLEPTATVVPTATPVATVVPTSEPTATPISDIGYIKYSLDNGKTWVEVNELTDDYGHRIAFTCAQAIFPDKAWDYKYTDADWGRIEKTWIDVQISVPEGVISRIWCFSWKQGKKIHQGGYLMELNPGHYEFAIKNGEAQNWATSDSYYSIDLNRIFDQKREGHVNVKHPLDFDGITANLKDRIPEDLKYNEVIKGPVPTK